MTDYQRESRIESAIHMLKKYDKAIGSENKFDFNKIREQLLSESEAEFVQTFSIILLLDGLTEQHIAVRELIENVNTYEDNYIKNIYLGGKN